MKVTKNLLAACYNLLLETPPFNRWVLPPAHEVRFDVAALRGAVADYEYKEGVHILRASSRYVSQIQTLLPYVAHEIVHMRVTLKHPKERGHHGANWKRLARLVCKHHGWDERHF